MLPLTTKAVHGFKRINDIFARFDELFVNLFFMSLPAPTPVSSCAGGRGVCFTLYLFLIQDPRRSRMPIFAGESIIPIPTTRGGQPLSGADAALSDVGLEHAGRRVAWASWTGRTFPDDLAVCCMASQFTECTLV